MTRVVGGAPDGGIRYVTEQAHRALGIDGTEPSRDANTIVDDLVKAISPRFIRIPADWYVRGGIRTYVSVEHRAKGWKPQPPVDLSGWPE